jgi:XisH protein
MTAKDKFHDSVKRGLEKEKWTVTHDPLKLEYAKNERVEMTWELKDSWVQRKQERKSQSKLKVF